MLMIVAHFCGYISLTANLCLQCPSTVINRNKGLSKCRSILSEQVAAVIRGFPYSVGGGKIFLIRRWNGRKDSERFQ